jgi:hypothetical protein
LSRKRSGPFLSHGLKKKSHGLKNKSQGFKKKSHGLKNKSHGLKNKSHGLKNKSHGLKTGSHGLKRVYPMISFPLPLLSGSEAQGSPDRYGVHPVSGLRRISPFLSSAF